MSTIEHEKKNNWYNANMKEHPVIEEISPHNPPSHDFQEQEEEITPQVGKLAPKKRIRYSLIGESSKKWKVDRLN